MRLEKIVKSVLTAMLLSLFASGVKANETTQSFNVHSQVSTFEIAYNDWSYILSATVFEAGRSDRYSAPRPEPGIGRRVIKGNTSSTRFEGNRLYFLAFDDANLAALLRIRAELAAVPGEVPIAEWTKNQQLAYWLNLYNVTIISELAQRYPEQELRSLLYGKRGLLDKKLLKVAGVKLSLNDIHHNIILANWDDPLVIYGLFHGYVGCANIRPEAYTADKVWEQLKDNAVEFVNSNRGARMRGNVLNVSAIYEDNTELFPSEAALRSHIAAYADPSFAERVRGASRIKADVTDYYIADLFQGVVNDTNPNAGNPSAVVQGLRGRDAALLSDMFMPKMLPSGAPKVVMEYLGKIREKKASREGQVSVEEYESSEGEAQPE